MLSHMTSEQMSNLLTQIAAIITSMGVIIKLLLNNAEANKSLANSVPSDLAHKLADCGVNTPPSTVVNNSAPAAIMEVDSTTT